MAKIAYTNTGATTIHVGGKAIPPGGTREVEESMLPSYAPKTPAAEAPKTDPLADLIAHSVKDIVARIPELTDDELEALGDMEQAKGDDARKTLLGAIAEEQLKRAEAKE